MGYAGGISEDPTYRSIGDHSEAIEITYDSNVISYEELLEVFWKAHSPLAQPFSMQYMSRILYSSNAQRRAAEKSKIEYEKEIGQPVHTEIKKLDVFYQAEDYHQKYTLQSYTEIFQTLQQQYPDMQDLIESTAAARLNGYLAGYGTAARLQAEIDTLGLSESGKETLQKWVNR